MIISHSQAKLDTYASPSIETVDWKHRAERAEFQLAALRRRMNSDEILAAVDQLAEARDLAYEARHELEAARATLRSIAGSHRAPELIRDHAASALPKDMRPKGTASTESP